ncbi:MAG: glycosyltransferase, partial [Dehalococcoidia bacterium]
PIDWPEPFGLVMIEAMACGTPVIAYRRGSVPEVMVDGVTGFVVDTLDEAVKAVNRVASLDRRKVREVFERRFTARRMAEDYLKVYTYLIQQFRSIEPLTQVSAPMVPRTMGMIPSNPALQPSALPAKIGKNLNRSSDVLGASVNPDRSFGRRARKH